MSRRRVLESIAAPAGGSSTPAFVVAVALVVGAAAVLLPWAGIPVEPLVQRASRLAGPAATAAAAVILLRRLAFRSLFEGPRAAQTAASFDRQDLAQVRAFLAECGGTAQPDIRLIVDYLVQQAVHNRASDVHLVPYEHVTVVRYRIDGILQDAGELSGGVRDAVGNRLKVLARLVTFVHDRPQDGRLVSDVDGRPVDIRVAFMPTLHGERVVLRLLSRGAPSRGLAGLGFTPGQQRTFEGLIRRPEGMVIVTGPTGAGKTTTIYAALDAILRDSGGARSVYTLEDPIEYDLAKINQTQIEASFGFPQGLRSMLRQDPDVIMVGEIRDLETARIALQAGMTGHLIITTVHAKSSAAAFARLVEMGADPHSVASAVTAVVGQRLVRLLCRHCRIPDPRAAEHAEGLGPLPEGTFLAAAGCARCHGKGYQGRTGVFEVLEVDEDLGRRIVQRVPADVILRQAAGRGMQTLTASALALAARGETSLEEVRRMMPS
jgi:general secretion pathway protein E